MSQSQLILALAIAVSSVPVMAEGPVAPTGAAPAAAPAPAAPETEPGYVPTGEVRLRVAASYNATRVRGPTVNLTLTPDGQWGGTVSGQPVRLRVTPERITGAGVNLVISRTAEQISVEGTWVGARARITATQASFQARIGQQQVDLSRRPDGSWAQRQTTGGVLPIRFTGSADRMPDVPMPQWILAVIAAM